MSLPSSILRHCNCTVCSHFFMSEKDLRFHMRNEHRSTYPLIYCERLHPTICLLCGKNCNTRRILSIHMKEAHDKGAIVREGSFKVVLRKFELRIYNTSTYVLCWFFLPAFSIHVSFGVAFGRLSIGSSYLFRNSNNVALGYFVFIRLISFTPHQKKSLNRNSVAWPLSYFCCIQNEITTSPSLYGKMPNLSGHFCGRDRI